MKSLIGRGNVTRECFLGDTEDGKIEPKALQKNWNHLWHRFEICLEDKQANKQIKNKTHKNLHQMKMQWQIVGKQQGNKKSYELNMKGEMY